MTRLYWKENTDVVYLYENGILYYYGAVEFHRSAGKYRHRWVRSSYANPGAFNAYAYNRIVQIGSWRT